MIFHLVLSSFTFDGVDVGMAQKIIDWNLKRYPNGELLLFPTDTAIVLSFEGVFFLFGAGRSSLVRSQPRRAISFYTRAMEVQSQYRNLHHISFWEIAIATLALWDLKDSLESWKVLQEEATVSVKYSRHLEVVNHFLFILASGQKRSIPMEWPSVSSNLQISLIEATKSRNPVLLQRR